MSYEYDLYLKEHVANVMKGYEWLRANIPDIIKEDISIQIRRHDQSKLTKVEYEGYDGYFYSNEDKEANPEIKEEFNLAWLHHIHENKHHWQHWVLINDNDGKNVPIDIPYNYVIEMICDWWSFSWKQGDLYEIFNWYEHHKDNILFTEETKTTVETILSLMKETLYILEKGDK